MKCIGEENLKTRFCGWIDFLSQKTQNYTDFLTAFLSFRRNLYIVLKILEFRFLRNDKLYAYKRVLLNSKIFYIYLI